VTATAASSGGVEPPSAITGGSICATRPIASTRTLTTSIGSSAEEWL